MRYVKRNFEFRSFLYNHITNIKILTCSCDPKGSKGGYNFQRLN